jgi:undecaprenyl-diphosphatase
MEYLHAVIMGLIEAATEFLPVSSTGHLILADRVLGFKGPPGHVFEVVIQLGAILAICVLYFKKLLSVVTNLHKDEAARHFAIVSIIAFIPAMIAGGLLHGIIKTFLFSPFVVCTMLVVGGVAIIVIERLKPVPQLFSIETIPYKTAFLIGMAQCLALVPGVSRSGATILGALCFGVERKTAAEFSFFQAIPIMLGAVTLDLFKNRHFLSTEDMSVIAIGFITAFIGALCVVRWMLGFVTRNGFTPFAWYRIVVGTIGLIVLTFIP